MVDSKSVGTIGVALGVVAIIAGFTQAGFLLVIGGVVGTIAMEIVGGGKQEDEL